MADLIHKNLTDPQLHEPKGISQALQHSVYVADGAGSGHWHRLHIGEMNYQPGAVPAEIYEPLPKAINIDSTGISSATDGRIADAKTFEGANKNVKELAKELEQISAQIAMLEKNTSKIQLQITKMAQALAASNIITIQG